jgi:predicted nucleic-acid-binding protein
MIGLDTNVLLRLGDEFEPAQRRRALALIRAQGFGGCFVNVIVLCEFSWTLSWRWRRGISCFDRRPPHQILEPSPCH